MSVTTKQAKDTKRKLPDGWRWVRLKEMGVFEAGGTPAKEYSDYWNGEIPFVTGADITDFCVNKANARAFLTRDGLYSGKTVICESGTVIIVTRTRVGRSGIAQETMGASQDITAFKCGPEIHQEFLCRYLHNISEHLTDNCRGATIQGLTREFVDNLEIPLPPFSEQRRIAGLLREQIKSVEKARAAAQARLAAVKALPAAFLRQAFPKPDHALPDGWRWVRLGEVCQFVGGSQPSKGNFRYEPALGYVRLVQIQDFRLSDVAVFIPEQMALRTFEIADVMIGRYGPPVFQILRGLSGAYNVALMKTVPSEILDKDFLYFLLQWPPIQRDVITQSQRSAGQSGVQKEYLEKYVIPLPPMCQQRNIAAQLNEQMVAVEKARAAAEEELNTIKALPAALLCRAFNGEI